MDEILFRVENGKVYFDDGRGYGLEECVGIINGLIGIANSGAVKSTASEQQNGNVINYEDILNKRVILGDNSKSTMKLKQWLDNDPDVIEEDKAEV
jgi:hypothetical protein